MAKDFMTRAEASYLLGLDGDTTWSYHVVSEDVRRKLEEAPTAIERTGEAKKHYLRAEELVFSNMLSQDKSIFQQAIDEYSEVIKLLPHDHESYDKRGSLYSKLKQVEKAIDDYNKAVSLNPKEGEYYMSLSSVYFDQGKRQEAEAYLQKALLEDPAHAGTHYCRFGISFEYTAKDKDKAVEYYKKSITHGDFDGYAKSALVRLGLREPNPAGSEELFVLYSIHERFATAMTGKMTAWMAGYLAGMFNAQFVLVEQLLYKEYLDSLDKPTELMTLNLETLNAKAVLEIAPALRSAVVNKIHEKQYPKQKPDHSSGVLHEISEDVTKTILRALDDAWSETLALKSALVKTETDPHLVNLALPDEFVMQAVLEVESAGVKGKISVCYPWPALNGKLILP